MLKNKVSMSRLKGGAYALPFVAIGVLIFILNTTSPAEIGPAGIFGVFILLYLFWLGVVFTILRISTALIHKVKRRHVSPDAPKKEFNSQQAYYIASVIAFIPVLILAMQSVGQLELRDVLLVLIFVSLVIFYIVKRA